MKDSIFKANPFSESDVEETAHEISLMNMDSDEKNS